jgi:hypothetical protein
MFFDENGNAVCVYQINRRSDLVVLDSAGGRFEMSLEALGQAIEDGEFEEATDDEEVGEEEEG